MQQHSSIKNFSCVSPQELRRPKYLAPNPSSKHESDPECTALFFKMFQGYFYLSEACYLSKETKQFFRIQVLLISSYCIFKEKTTPNSIQIKKKPKTTKNQQQKKKKINWKAHFSPPSIFTASFSKFCPILNNFSELYSLIYFNTLTVESLVFLPTHMFVYFFPPTCQNCKEKLFE